jgi:hypothetical protein
MSSPVLARKIFSVSRLAEFASEAELEKQTGQPPGNWPLVIIKELVDNALDAAEESGAAPDVDVAVEGDGAIVVSDHGPGLPAKIVARLVDYTRRTSSRAAYVSPTRGAQGNALQTLLAMPYVLDGERGETLIESGGVAHRIAFSIDPVRQTPRIEHARTPSAVRNGTKITLRWPDRACSKLEAAKAEILSLTTAFAWLNPHLTLSSRWCEELVRSSPATDPAWRKWRANMPTSPHWYDVPRLMGLVAANIADAEDRRQPCQTVRDFVREFRGLSSTVKAAEIGEAVGAVGETLAEFHKRGEAATAQLLAAMRERSRPVPPRELGIIGKEHLQRLAVELAGVVEDTFQYRAAAFEHDGLPYVIETAFGLRRGGEDCGEGGEDCGEGAYIDVIETAFGLREDCQGAYIVEGFNFTPAIGGSPFRLEARLAQQMVEEHDPVFAFMHLVSPRLAFLDRGKSRVALPREVEWRLFDMVGAVTKRWCKQRKAEERHARAHERRLEALRIEERPMSIREAAFAVMEDAYQAASANGTLPANPRQVYYAARGEILALTGKDRLDSNYFTQTLLIDYVEEHDCAWDLAFDARGHLSEPHGGASVDLGTLAVRDYLDSISEPAIAEAAIRGASVSLFGPNGRYGAVLFVEKEGFAPILQRARIAERFDVAVMSTKGMSVVAARRLVDGLAAHGVRLMVLRDFDIAGFSIRKTLTESGRRYRFENTLDFVDLGLRLVDVERLALQSEAVAVGKDEDATRRRLRINGASEAEADFLLGGRRVELNAMPSDVFVRFVEDGLRAHGIAKVVPGLKLLAETYAAMKRGVAVKTALRTEIRRLTAEPVETPPDLAARVHAYLAARPTASWPTAVAAVAARDSSAPEESEDE